MRWKRKEPVNHKRFEKRIVKRFLWLPKCIEGECRWLEVGEWVQRWVAKTDETWGGTICLWEDYCWVDKRSE